MIIESENDIFITGDKVTGIKTTVRKTNTTMSVKEGTFIDFDGEFAVILQRNGKKVKVKTDTLRMAGSKNALQESIDKIKDVKNEQILKD